jgi:Family of unknown function (DUF6491)
MHPHGEHSMRAMCRALAIAALLVLAACSSGPQQKTSQDLALQRYMAYAGPPIQSFWWPGRFYSWEPLGKDRLLVLTTASDAYLLKIWPPCDLRSVVTTIGLTTTSSYVYAHLDSVTMNSAGTGPGRWRCPIEEIRKVDYRRMRADMRAGKPPPAPADAAPAQPAPPAATPPVQPPPQ